MKSKETVLAKYPDAVCEEHRASYLLAWEIWADKTQGPRRKRLGVGRLRSLAWVNAARNVATETKPAD